MPGQYNVILDESFQLEVWEASTERHLIRKISARNSYLFNKSGIIFFAYNVSMSPPVHP